MKHQKYVLLSSYTVRWGIRHMS